MTLAAGPGRLENTAPHRSTWLAPEVPDSEEMFTLGFKPLRACTLHWSRRVAVSWHHGGRFMQNWAAWTWTLMMYAEIFRHVSCLPFQAKAFLNLL